MRIRFGLSQMISCVIALLFFKVSADEIGQETHMEKNKYGQYFTPQSMADFMVRLSSKKESEWVLEPSAGEGVFIKLLHSRGRRNIVGYEIDPELAKNFDCVRCESFISAEPKRKFALAIGNPPYIRWKNLEKELKDELAGSLLWRKYFNALCDYSYIFMLKSVELLEDGGELIFICPEYWMNTTHSITLRNYFVEHGYFSDFYIFNETPIFTGATVSTVVFKYVKSMSKQRPKIRVAKFKNKAHVDESVFEKLLKRESVDFVDYMEIEQFEKNKRWVFVPDEKRKRLERFMESCSVASNADGLFCERKIFTIGDCCDIGNGMVSGLDRAFQLTEDVTLNSLEKKGMVVVHKAKDLCQYFPTNLTRYILLDEAVKDEGEFQSKYPHLHEHLRPFRSDLEKRYQYNRTIPYWQWSFRRNETLFRRREKRIYVPCKERISAKSYVRFAMAEADTFPTQDVTAIFLKPGMKESIEYLLAYLNHPLVFEWIRNYGIVKGNIVEFSEKPIASIPFRRIDWGSRGEVEIHKRVVELVHMYQRCGDESVVKEINENVEALWKL